MQRLKHNNILLLVPSTKTGLLSTCELSTFCWFSPGEGRRGRRDHTSDHPASCQSSKSYSERCCPRSTEGGGYRKKKRFSGDGWEGDLGRVPPAPAPACRPPGVCAGGALHRGAQLAGVSTAPPQLKKSNCEAFPHFPNLSK